ncbi:GNAT family N-acetyltransferase [Aestuariibacter halophilus]|uniref:GNAT family N-acetyltransferase n=1 Tax=Fluctibacter halophilus TaxID=226011 RepID=A0ABS8G858_9ALTE|nr:GNAT family N-acetyltransferase [Aestuariibacter halophilus]MCC2616281.1 GNAT family N-acetyltransferase [Aestuariibacter halophilus]
MIRAATSHDCANIALLGLCVWIDTYATDGIKTAYTRHVLDTFTEHRYQALLNDPHYHLLVSEQEGILQGYVLINLASHYQHPDNGFEIDTLYVDKRHAGLGIGRQLLEAVQGRFGDRYWLYTWTQNAANGFYQHLGLKPCGQIDFEFDGVTITNTVYLSPGSQSA